MTAPVLWLTVSGSSLLLLLLVRCDGELCITLDKTVAYKLKSSSSFSCLCASASSNDVMPCLDFEFARGMIISTSLGGSPYGAALCSGVTSREQSSLLPHTAEAPFTFLGDLRSGEPAILLERLLSSPTYPVNPLSQTSEFPEVTRTYGLLPCLRIGPLDPPRMMGPPSAMLRTRPPLRPTLGANEGRGASFLDLPRASATFPNLPQSSIRSFADCISPRVLAFR
ncbi:MAG: hypothetical protein SGPRY_010703 [Prymnesium sp.]